MKPLIIGEGPSKYGDPSRPIGGRIGRRLAALSGVDSATFAQQFSKMNLLDTWPGQSGKGSKFDAARARESAQRSGRRLRRGRIVILLGKRVAEAFGIEPVYFDRQSLRDADAFVVPHPSGVNRWYNVSSNRRKMRAFMMRVAERSLC